MFRTISPKEETILKRAFNNWGIFELYDNNCIMLKEIKEDETKKKKSVKPCDTYNLVENSDGYNSSKIEEGLTTKTKKNIPFKQVFICNDGKQTKLSIQLQPVLSGLNIGSINNKKFFPNLNFAEMVVNSRKELDYPHVIVNDKATNLVLYGRDILGNSIVSFFKEIRENQMLIILDKDKEVIGIGRSRFNNDLIIQADKITVDNIQDIGTFYLKGENYTDTVF